MMSPVLVLSTLLPPPGPRGGEGRRGWGGHTCRRDGGGGLGIHIVFLSDRLTILYKSVTCYRMMSPVLVLPTVLPPPGPRGGKGKRGWGGHTCKRDGGDSLGIHIVFFLCDRMTRL